MEPEHGLQVLFVLHGVGMEFKRSPASNMFASVKVVRSTCIVYLAWGQDGAYLVGFCPLRSAN